jgi:tetratricopeptide (TPR) repeat protein
LAYGRDADDKWSIGVSLLNLANVVMHQGDFEWARALCQESLVVFQQAGDKRGLAFALNTLGLIAHDQGDFIAARKPFEQALAVQRQLGDKRGIGISLTNLGLLAWELGDYDAAVSLYEEALAIRRQLGDKRGVATLLYYLGQVELRQGDYLQATSLFSESLVMRKAAGSRGGVARSLEGLARAARRHPERAARLFGAVATIQETVGEVRSQPEQVEYERDLSAVRTELGVETFSAAWNEGRAMTLDQAVEYALVSVAPLSNPPLFERPSQPHPSESNSAR